MIDPLLEGAPIDDWRTYAPVLRAKASEWKALEELSPGVRRRIAPILEFVPDWKDPGASTSTRKRRAPQTPSEYAERMLDSSIAATPVGTRSFAYFGHVGTSGRWLGIDLLAAFNSRVPTSTRLAPLVDLANAGVSGSLNALVRSRGELGLRLSAGDVGPSLLNRVTTAIRNLGVGPENVHIVVDLKNQPTAVSHSLVRGALAGGDVFASVVVLGGVFPENLSQYRVGVTAEPRVEWSVWWNEHRATSSGERILSFGDYTTHCALYQPSVAVAPSISLRYTTDDSVLVFRGRQSNNSSGFGHDQMHGHCRMLVGRPDYDGAGFSLGDHRFYCWRNPPGTGNPTQWRTASLVHHITHVVAQLHDPVGSSETARNYARNLPIAACA